MLVGAKVKYRLLSHMFLSTITLSPGMGDRIFGHAARIRRGSVSSEKRSLRAKGCGTRP